MNEKILAILSDINEEILSYTGTNMVGDGLLDSFEIISLISTLEDEFDLEIDAGYVAVENFANKDSVISLVARLLNE